MGCAMGLLLFQKPRHTGEEYRARGDDAHEGNAPLREGGIEHGQQDQQRQNGGAGGGPPAVQRINEQDDRQQQERQTLLRGCALGDKEKKSVEQKAVDGKGIVVFKKRRSGAGPTDVAMEGEEVEISP